MRHLILTASLLLPVTFQLANADVGISIISIPAPHHGKDMETGIFFPSEGGSVLTLGENGVFHGATVHEYAKPTAGKHPVVLMSHGWGGNYRRMAWLSAALAEMGAIVVAVNHPNSMTGDLNNRHALDHWTRAQDLTTALDHLMQSPDWSVHVDTTRIYAAGFSYGGWTALSLGGLKGQRDGLDALCSATTGANSHCADILESGITIAEIDEAAWNAPYKDPRISAVAAIDPALTWGLQIADTTDLNIPVLLIGLGDGESRLYATDTSAAGSNFAALLPAAKIEQIVPATHFKALGLCKPEGAAILAEEKDDPVCSDPPGTDRRAVMNRIVIAIARHFRLI